MIEGIAVTGHRFCAPPFVSRCVCLEVYRGLLSLFFTLLLLCVSCFLVFVRSSTTSKRRWLHLFIGEYAMIAFEVGFTFKLATDTAILAKTPYKRNKPQSYDMIHQT